MGNLLFVHGTGVRLPDYRETSARLRGAIAAAGLDLTILPCAWGDPLGVDFEGLALPDPPDEAELAAEAEATARWAWLFDDPFFELGSLTIRGHAREAPFLPPDKVPEWQAAWTRISAYSPSQELTGLLARTGLSGDWDAAMAKLRGSGLPARALEASAAEKELADAVSAVARALVALLHVGATDDGRPGPSQKMREAIRERLIEDWDYAVLGLGTFIAGLFKRAGTRALRRRRNKFSGLSALPLGDILLYQARGAEVHDFIRAKIAQAAPPVTILAHSLGGIASFDLLAMPDPPKVAGLITIGSQAPYFYEIGALQSLRRPEGLPADFPPWLNIYDRDDFLSFVGHRLFPGRVEDVEVKSGQPFPASHSAYFGNPDVWAGVKDFLAR